MLLQNIRQGSPTAVPPGLGLNQPVGLSDGKRRTQKGPLLGGVAGMVVMLAILLGAEIILPPDFKPSTFVGGFTGNSESVVLLTKLKATRAMLAAQNGEQARMQQQVEMFRAQTERVTGYYQVAYQRLATMAQAANGVEQQFLATRSELAAKAQEGNVNLANMSSYVGALAALTGHADLAKTAQEAGQGFRQQALDSLDNAQQAGMAKAGANIDAWQAGLPDLQQLSQLLNHVPGQPLPKPPLPTPSPPEIYAAPDNSGQPAP